MGHGLTRCHGMYRDAMACHGMSWHVMGCHGILWDVMGCHGIIAGMTHDVMLWYSMASHGVP